MVNFRYHVVSLVAVLFALSIGVLLGVSSGIDDATVNRLDTARRNLSKTNESLRKQVEGFEQRIDRFDQYSQSARDILVKDALQGRRVVLLSFESTDSDDLGSVETVLLRAGAGIEASIRLFDRLDLATDARRRQAALALNVPSTTGPNELHAGLVRSVSEALSGAKPGFILRLIEAELAEQREVPGAETKSPADLSPQGTLVVILASERDEQMGLEEGFVVPLAEALAGAGVVTAVGETDARGFELVGTLRESGAARVVTVDSIETPVGQSAVVLGLQAAINGRFGHYGFAEGTTVLPESAENP